MWHHYYTRILFHWVLRDKTKENVVGQFTKSWYSDGTLAHMAFWIRLERNKKMIYEEYDNTQLTVAMLELAVHERAHYDVTKSNIWADIAICTKVSTIH